jgi:outer membrane protein assembly complex protein YaeT
MTACRRVYRTLPLAAVLAAVAVLVWSCGGLSADSPAGKTIADIVPVNNRTRTPAQILNLIQSRPGKPYDEATIQEDVRRLHATRWFAPGGVQVHTKNDPDGRVTVFIYVTELTSTVQDIEFRGVQHLSKKDLQELTGIRKGDPMNPLANELGRAAILRRYQEDGRYYTSVTLAEGGTPTDTRVVYEVVESPVVKVCGVDFRGNERATSGRLRAQLTTKRDFLGFGGKFNPMTMDKDQEKLIQYYHGLGFLAVQITPEVVPDADPGKVLLVYHIVEGQQYVIAGRQLDGNYTFSSDKLEPLAEVKPGDRYDSWKVKKDLARIDAYYGNRGYSVKTQEQLYEIPGQPGVVQVHYQVQGDRGEPKRVGRVIVDGNDITQDRVILNQLDLRPGQILQYPKLKEAEARLARLGIFDPENPPTVTIEPTDFDSVFEDIRVHVNETRTGQFMIGGAVNSNNGVSGNIVINERNFDLFRFPTSWDDFRYGRAFRGAGQEFRIEAVPATTFQRYSATFREPYLFDTQFGLTNSIYYFQRQYVEYQENRVGDRFTIDRRLDPIWSASASLRVEGVEVKNVPIYAPPSIAGDIGWHFLLGLGGGLKRDTRDSFIYPTTGSILDMRVEQVLGANAFPIGTAEFTKFFSSQYLQREDGSGKHVLALRSQVSVEGGNAPVYERFFAGGFRSLRGFTFRGVGPSENTLFTGGTFSWLNTVEYQIPLDPRDRFHFVTFVDHGTVEQDVAIRNYRVAAGFGFRVAVPALGPLPIAFDFAFPITKAPQDNRQVFSFYVGLFGGP